MNGYFKPLRRKIGVVTLLLACAFTAGWVRSTVILDDFVFIHRTHTAIGALSIDQRIAYASLVFPEDRRPLTRLPLWQSSPYQKLDDLLDQGDMRRLMEWQGFIVAQSEAQDVTFYFAPYWSIVIPLTLLSAWLLVWKPRTKNDRPTAPASENA